MKKLFLTVCTTFLLSYTANAQVKMASVSPEDIQLRTKLNDDFASSNIFSLITDNVKPFGTISFKEVNLVQRTMEGSSANVLNYKVMNNNVTAGYLQVIKDENGAYYTQLIDFKDFDVTKNEGKLAFWDIRTNEKIVTVTVAGGKIIGTVFDNPKYESSNTVTNKKNPFDLNGNGDVSFFECYKVANDAIEQDGFSSWVCDFPVLGWLSCWGTVSAACAYYSAGH